MTSLKRADHRIWFLLLLSFPIALFGISSKLAAVKQFDAVVIALHDSGSGATRALPTTQRYEKPNRSGLTGVIAGSDIPSTASHMYFTKLEGILTMRIGDEIFYADPSSKSSNLAQSNDLLVALPSSYRVGEDIQIDLVPNQIKLVSLSKIYLGSAEDFRLPGHYRWIYFSVLRPASLGVELFILVLILIISISRASHQYRAMGAATAYLFIIEGNALLADRFAIPNAFHLIILLLPIMVGAALILIEQLAYGRVRLYGLMIVKLGVTAAAALTLLLLVTPLDITAVTFFYSVPVGILVGLTCSGIALVRAFQLRLLDVFAVALALFSFGLSMVHDFLYLLSIVDTGIVLSAINAYVYVTALCIVVFLRVMETDSRLRDNQTLLKLSLAQQAQQLKEAFKKEAVLAQDARAQKEKILLINHLHDGVLGYLSTIHAVSEVPDKKGFPLINQLSKNAINELRLIIEADADTKEGSLFRTCSSLRTQIEQALQFNGVEVRWNLLSLLDYSVQDPKLNLEIFRILQEAIHNASIRAQCKILAVTSGQTSSGSHYLIVENSGGRALNDAVRRGSGIASMARRAHDIGAIFAITNIDSGAHLRMELPSHRDQ